MSWQAVQRVLVAGPDDDKLFRLLVNVAYSADADGRDGKVGQRLLADRCHATIYRIRELLFRAVEDGWLEVALVGNGRARTAYDLGPRLDVGTQFTTVARDMSRAGCGIDAQNRAQTFRFDAQNRAPVSSKSYVSAARRPQPRGRRAAAEGEAATPPVPADPPSNGKSIYDDPYRFPNWSNGEGQPK